MLLPGVDVSWVLHSGEEEVSVLPQGRFSINNLSMLRQLTVSGAGIGAFDAVVADSDIRDGRLVRVLPEWSMHPLPIHLLSPGSRLSRRVRPWVDFLAERLRGFDCSHPG
jgi:DNA-binding transcriptional LysR family regulator